MTVEDGTGLEDANSYCDVSMADTYHEARGNEAWAAATTAKRAAALVCACDYLEGAYGRLFPGVRLNDRQRLRFPRYGIDGVECSEIPAWLKEAQAEAALLEITEKGILFESMNEGGILRSWREGEVARGFQGGSDSIRRFPSILRLLAPHIRNPARIATGRSC
jgi:hypothetical protein